jgi:glycosyltransferase involved in cell wall biosynthesis
VIRILHIITRLDVGGSAENTVLSAIRLPQTKFACGLAVGRTIDPPPGLHATLDRSGVPRWEVEGLVRSVRPLADLRVLVALRRLIREFRPDIVHTHSSKAGFLGRVAARWAGVCHIVHTPHGHVFDGYFSPAVTRVFILLERLAARWTDRIVTLTDAEAEQHLALGIGRREQFVTIPSGVELEAVLGAAPIRLAEGGRVVGTVGRLAPVKGHRHLLDATPILLKRCADATVVLVGDGERRGALETQARDLGIAERVRFTGYREDVAALIAGMDLFVLPSLNEGMGRVLVIAMALGKPIVATAVGGVPELLGHGEAGVLVPASDPRALGDAIAELLSDPARAARLGETARRRAPRYSADAMVEALATLYRRLASGVNERLAGSVEP